MLFWIKKQNNIETESNYIAYLASNLGCSVLGWGHRHALPHWGSAF